MVSQTNLATGYTWSRFSDQPANNCILIVPDDTNRLIHNHIIMPTFGSDQIINERMTENVASGEVWYFSRSQSKYLPVIKFISFEASEFSNTENLFIVQTEGNQERYVDINNVCPRSSVPPELLAFISKPIMELPKRIRFEEVALMLQRGDIVSYSVNPSLQIPGSQNTIITLIDQFGNKFLVEAKLYSNGMIYPPS